MKDGHWNAGVTTTGGVTLGFIGAVLIMTISVKNESLDWSDWLQFAGTLIGAAATIAAGVLAWISIQRQIDAPEYRSIQVILTFTYSARDAASVAISSLSELISNESKLDVIDVMREHKIISSIADRFSKSICLVNDVDEACKMAPAIVILRTRDLQNSINIAKSDLCNSKRYSDIIALRSQLKRVYIDADDVIAAMNKHSETKI
ncbi:hypothetical protein [Xanthobacter aminoxidans]|uniref:hypothetical protein n=1 Tax=Xanthobacter aminoxidans TaxID=186280 RepID=UPI00202303AF|nr:hypothetical protein [Xanthobacter aminoxidans]MCL8382474.1 hypothetical protein [Xanthobacter aminoxidans]